MRLKFFLGGILFIILIQFLFIAGAKNDSRGAKMTIELNLIDCRYSEDNKFYYPIGEKIMLEALFKNQSDKKILIQDPSTSQFIIGYLKTDQNEEEIVFEFNPGMIDSTGEISAPVSQELDLQTGKTLSVKYDLNEKQPDIPFQPGKYEIAIEYDGITKSKPQTFYIALTSESVMPLLEALQDSDKDEWQREQAYSILKKLFDEFEFIFDTSKTENIKADENSIEKYKKWWEENMHSEDVLEEMKKFNGEAGITFL